MMDGFLVGMFSESFSYMLLRVRYRYAFTIGFFVGFFGAAAGFVILLMQSGKPLLSDMGRLGVIMLLFLGFGFFVGLLACFLRTNVFASLKDWKDAEKALLEEGYEKNLSDDREQFIFTKGNKTAVGAKSAALKTMRMTFSESGQVVREEVYRLQWPPWG